MLYVQDISKCHWFSRVPETTECACWLRPILTQPIEAGKEDFREPLHVVCQDSVPYICYDLDSCNASRAPVATTSVRVNLCAAFEMQLADCWPYLSGP